jgi:hypothetical protein
MSRNVILHGGVNTIQGDVYILEAYGGVINLYGRAGAINQFGGVLNDKRSQPSCQGTDPRQESAKVQSPGTTKVPSPGTTTKIVYRDRVVYRDKIVYRDADELSDGIWIEKITRLENEHEAEVKELQAEIALLKERLQGALDAYHGVFQSASCCQGTVPRQTTAKVQSPGSNNWDDYKPTKAECEAVYKNFKVWLECEEELEPINL